MRHDKLVKLLTDCGINPEKLEDADWHIVSAGVRAVMVMQHAEDVSLLVADARSGRFRVSSGRDYVLGGANRCAGCVSDR